MRRKDGSLSDDGQSRVDESLVRLILQYLVEHPDAKDTPEGIQKWWLPEGASHRSRDEVQSALNLLSSQGWLMRRQTRQSEEIYGINKNEFAAIRRFLGWEKPRRKP
jgi:hypothetical protein